MTNPKNRYCINLKLLLGLLLLTLGSGALAQNVAFKDIRVFDGNEVLTGTTVVVENGVITKVAADATIPGGTTIIEGAGLTLLPGLIDAHVHTFTVDALQQDLMFGVTTVLDMFMDPGFAAHLRAEQVDHAVTDRADVYSAGYLATVPDGHGTQFGLAVPTITDAADAEAWVQARIAEGSNYIKVILESGEELGMPQPTLDEAVLRAIVTAAHAHGLLVVAHVQTLEFARLALDTGVDGLAHMFVDEVADEEFVVNAVYNNLFVIPTMSVFQSIGNEPLDESVINDELLHPYLPFSDLQNLATPFSGFPGLSLENALQSTRLLYEAGVPILAGTDAPNPGTAYGASLHRELVLLTMAGLTPAEALAAVTSVAAGIFGLTDVGVIAPGMHADLLLVAGDPTSDILATRDIQGVWKNGVAVDRVAWRRRMEAQKLALQQGSATLAGATEILISDFEQNDLSVQFGQIWVATTDADAGGNSTASLQVVPGGPADSQYALEVSGEVGTDFELPWSGVMFMPGAVPFAPANLSHLQVLNFSAQGEAADYRVQLFCQNTAQAPGEWPFSVTPDWQDHQVDLASIAACDTSGVMAIIFSSGMPGQFSFMLDDVKLN